MRTGPVTGIVALLAAVTSLLLMAPPGTALAASSAGVQCQHPLTTGVEVLDLVHIRPDSACPVAMKLYRYEISGHGIVDCHEEGAYRPPTLIIHRFRGWRLHLSGDGVFSMHRGRRSFAVTGTDFPSPCG